MAKENSRHTNNEVAIGIDLGTTYSCCAVWRNGGVEMIPNENGNTITPSYVSFARGETVVGDLAKSQCSVFPKQTVFDAKRLIGRSLTERVVVKDREHWPFLVVESEAGKNLPAISIPMGNGKHKKFLPEEISSMVLHKMKDIAERYLGHPVTKAVVTVPAYFNDAQRHATKAAGAIAGLSVLRIVNEPTAAAIAYGLDHLYRKGERNVLVFDLGGGTFDVTLLALEEGIFHVKATAGDTHLGGEDFDNLLVEACMKKFRSKYPSLSDPTADEKNLRRLRTACERAKRTLSSDAVVTIEVPKFCAGNDLELTMSRGEMESICIEWFRKTIIPIDRVLKDSKTSKEDVHEIVLVGGSTRIPKVRSMISNYFNGKKINLNINADEAVAYGAAVQAAILCGVNSIKMAGLLLLDIIPMSLGLETAGGIMTKVIPRNTTVPTRRRHVFTTNTDNQDAVIIQIFEGERQFTKDCNKLGEFTLCNLPKMPRGVPQIEVILDIDSDGLLNVSASELSTGERTNITITNDSNQLSEEQVLTMVQEAENYRLADQIQKNIIQSRNNLNDFAYELSNKILQNDSVATKLNRTEVDFVENKIEEVMNWLDGCGSDKLGVYEDKLKELTAAVLPILNKCGFMDTSCGSIVEMENFRCGYFNGWQKRAHGGTVVENVDP